MARHLSRRRLSAHLSPLAAALVAVWPLQSVLAQPAPTALPSPAAQWVQRYTGSVAPVLSRPTGQPNSLLINQSGNRAIYNWNRFDIGSAASVEFRMPDANAAALNRIGGLSPSVIQGALKSNGQVWLINPNGVVFGQGARVDVGALITSTLNVADADFLDGLTSRTLGRGPAFRYDGAPEDFIDSRNFVRVDAGAEIRTAEGGRVFLFAKRVDNAGSISTPGGQTVLAGGGEVHLKLPTSEAIYASEVNPNVPAVQGLLVEVGSAAGRDGLVNNLASGSISTPRGNTTLVGLAVNQLGRISATTSVSQNGSVLLLAQGGTQVGPAGTENFYEAGSDLYKRAQRAGSLVLGSGSRVEITPDVPATGAAPTSDGNATFVPSRMALAGHDITLAAGALIQAPGASVTLRAGTPDYRADRLTSRAFTANDPTARISLADGATIDVAGTTSTVVSAARNFVTTELLGANDLKDAPLQKEGVLSRNRVTLDIRDKLDAVDSPILGELDSYRNAVQRTAEERLATGGSVDLRAEGAVVMHERARIDVSGGQVAYAEAMVTPTRLVAEDGSLYTLNTAPKDRVYERTINDKGTPKPLYDRWGVRTAYGNTLPAEKALGYVDGQSAGKLSVVAATVVLDGQLAGHTVVGDRQRSGLDAMAALGSLAVGTLQNAQPFGGSSYAGAVVAGTLRLGAQAGSLGEGFWLDPQQAALGTDSRVAAGTVMAGGFGQLTLASNSDVRIEGELALPDRGSLQVASRDGGVLIGANVAARAGSVKAQTLAGGDVTLAAGRGIDVSGRVLNERNDGPLARSTINGGSVTLQSRRGVLLQAGSSIDVDGGAVVTASGVQGGSGGSISLASGSADVSGGANLLLGGSLSGHALSRPGSLSISTDSIRIGNAAAGSPAASTTLDAGFFSRGGFASYSLDGREFVDLAAGTVVAPRLEAWMAAPGLRDAATGSALDAYVTAPAGALAPLPAPVNVSLASGGGALTVGAGAGLSLAAGATAQLQANTRLTMDGEIRAAGGSVTLRLTRGGTQEQQDYDNAQYLWLGGRSVIDVSGSTVLTPSANGLRQGTVQDGGRITLDAATAAPTSLVLQQGAQLRADGTVGTLDVSRQTAGATVVQRQTVASNGGSLTVRASRDLQLEGSFSARGGDPSAAGGSLSITLTSVPGSRVLTTLAAERELRISRESATTTAGLQPADLAAPRDLTGQTRVGADWLAATGVADLSLSSRDAIRLDEGVTLAPVRSLRLDTPALRYGSDTTATGSVQLSAATLTLANTQAPVTAGTNTRPAPVASSGTGQLLVQAGSQLSLEGAVATQGFGGIALRSQGDLRLVELLGVSGRSGAFNTAADLRLQADQIYPSTDSRFVIDAGNRVVRIAAGDDAAVQAPLASRGSLTIRAGEIEQAGLLRAPLGQITLQASGRLTLAPDSITSVSAAGLLLPDGDGHATGSLPTKQITLESTAGAVDVQRNAVLDLSGGGEVLSYLFVPGPGGSTDVFAGADGAYAIVPTVRNGAPLDATWAGTAPTAGRQLIIGPGGPLPEGAYTLLPARYALLPGAFLVKPQTGGTPLQFGTHLAQADGSSLVGAVTGSAGTALRDALSSTWRITPSDKARLSSEVRETTATKFYTQAAQAADQPRPPLPADGGTLVLAAQQA
ncbi:MAG: filamentous hemagglutinin N-terminal domain-containing protein, partial [Aquincola sp.]|nr:filamentous hemagglutinin N-terminal domain-containing protein [Aquincola sp.]